MAHFEISDKKVMAEAYAIIDEVYETEELEKFILKLLRNFKSRVDYDGHIGWYNIEKFVTREMTKQTKESAEENL